MADSLIVTVAQHLSCQEQQVAVQCKLQHMKMKRQMVMPVALGLVGIEAVDCTR